MKSVALIVTYNRLSKLKNCLKATLLLSFDNVVIINNASLDDTAQWLSEQKDHRLHVITMKQNLGGAGGFKYGAQYISKNLDTEWIFFYDDDAYPSANLLNQFEHIEKKDYQIFCSKVLLPSGKICKMNVPYKKIPYSTYETFLYSINNNKFLPNFNKQENVKTFSFVGAILHQDIIRHYADHIDEKLFLYFDDLLFSYYLTKSGYQILFDPNLLFIHDTIIDTNIYQNKKIYYLIRNLLSLRQYQYSPFSKSTIYLRAMYILILCILKGRNIHSIIHALKGIKDGFLCKNENVDK
ncbi:hypothetical protein HK18_08565 [Commensalibacter intestini]|uniref:Glycosyltransferase 2-like domain-containing protein n=1 Tax=Commensalibacter intestini TaxID=479936 RepID=A0A251ZV56_9PROT|nr:glycosyltransferase [Commensalibacter intestini]OUI78547.1 hypothetical protein HK18_08565 [Commensalibacter intestini]